MLRPYILLETVFLMKTKTFIYSNYDFSKNNCIFADKQHHCNMERTKIIDNIREVAKATLAKGSTLILYGSRARGDDHQGSDWDLLILLDKSEITDSDYDNVSFPFTLLGWNIGELISPQLYTKKEWDSISFLPFHKNVEHDKIVLL